MLATEYARYLNLEPQKEGESDSQFKNRVSGALRNVGQIIEAHEVAQDARWDSETGGEMVQMGIAGAMATALQGTSYGTNGSTLVGDEIAAGVVATAPKKDNDYLALMLMMLSGK